MMRNLGLVIALAVVVSMGMFSVQGALAADPIVIGVPTSTGFLEGKEALKAANLAVDEINATGFGLTLGVHSRIDGFAREVFAATRVGNTYINRNMVGAVVGVNPFGGQGLSGTGPKAGGPLYLQRFATEKTRTDNIVARGGNAQLFNLQGD